MAVIHTCMHTRTFSCCSDYLRAVCLNLQIGLGNYTAPEEAQQSNENLVVKIIRSQDI